MHETYNIVGFINWTEFCHLGMGYFYGNLQTQWRSTLPEVCLQDLTVQQWHNAWGQTVFLHGSFILIDALITKEATSYV